MKGWLVCAQHSDGMPGDGCNVDFSAAAYGNPVLIALGLEDMTSNQKSGTGLWVILKTVVELGWQRQKENRGGRR